MPSTPIAPSKTEKKPREKKPKRKNDARVVAAARELKDRWLEHVNAGMLAPTDSRPNPTRRVAPSDLRVSPPPPPQSRYNGRMEGGAYGGLLAMCLFVVAPVAFFVHLMTRRVVVASLATAGAFALFLLVVCVRFDSGRPDERWSDVRLVVLGALLGLVVSFAAAAPVWIVRLLRDPDYGNPHRG
jgi:hypothetical protein